MRVARGDAGAQAPVDAEREHLRPVRGRHLGRAVGRAVVDDEHVGVGQLGAQLVEDVGQVVLLVPGGDEDERVVRLGHPGDRSRSAHSRGGSDSVVSPRG